MMNSHQLLLNQRGATLLISLIMLVVLTLFAVAGFNLSSVNLKIAGNFQAQRGMEAAAQQAIEQVLSTGTAFSLTPAAQTVTVSGFNVAVNAPACNYYRTASGYGKDIEALAPEDTDWEVRAAVTDALTGAQANVTQGVAIRLPKGNCP
jgi:Tfp pilus assembly protein PilX